MTSQRDSRTTEAKACEHCGAGIPRNYFECNFCGQRHCADHRLPENHDCLGLKPAREADLDLDPSGHLSPSRVLSAAEGELDTDETKRSASTREVADHVSKTGVPDIDRYQRDKSVGYGTVEPTVYSSTPAPEYESSPDVAVDGSLKDTVEPTTPDDSTKSTGGSPFVRAALLLALAVLAVGTAYYLGIV